MTSSQDRFNVHHEANLIEQKLVALIRQLATSYPAFHRASPHPVQIHLSISLDPSQHWQPTPDHLPLLRQLLAYLEEHSVAFDAFQPGRVYCYRSHSAWCDEAIPPRPSAVFVGYSSTGVPQWKDFHQFLLEAGDDRVESLFAAPPRLLARTTLGRELKHLMLPECGKTSRSYNILGQVTAGYFPSPTSTDPRDTLALTFQIVESRAAPGLFRLELNVIGITPDGLPAATLLEYGAFPTLERACRPIERALKQIESLVRALPPNQTSRNERSRLLSRIPSLLSRLAGLLEQDALQTLRRTRHALERRLQARPVQCAIEDARDATSDRILWDNRHHTFIIRGPRNRVHAFTETARLVTSFALPSDQVERRLRTRLWRNTTPEEQSRFRTQLQSALTFAAP